jgi:hypothetical protein
MAAATSVKEKSIYLASLFCISASPGQLKNRHNGGFLVENLSSAGNPSTDKSAGRPRITTNSSGANLAAAQLIPSAVANSTVPLLAVFSLERR